MKALKLGLSFALLTIFSFCLTIAEAENPPLKLGAMFATTGWAAIGGKPEMNATIMAVDEINAAGGIAGRKIQLIAEDIRSDYPATISAFNKLVNIDKVAAIFGPNWIEFGEIVIPLAERNKLPTLMASPYSPSFEKKHSYVFTATPEFHIHVKELTNFIAKRNHKKIALIYSPSTYFEGITQATIDDLRTAGTNLQAPTQVLPNETDFKSILSRLQADKVDAVIAYIQEGPAISSFFRAARTLRFNPQVYSYDFSFDETIRKEPRIAEGAIIFNYSVTYDPKFERAYGERFKDQSNFSAPFAYDLVFLFKQAFEACNGEVSKLNQCIASTVYRGVTGELRFGPTGVITGIDKITRLMHINKGKFEPLL